MPNATFDTLKFARTLRDAGVPVAQAEAEAGVLAEIFSINFRDVLTKDDLGHAVTSVETKIRETEQRLNVRIDAARNELRETEQRLNNKIDLVKSDLTAKIDQVKTELTAKIDQNQIKTSTDFAYLKWMVGFGLTMFAGVIVRMFLFPAR